MGVDVDVGGCVSALGFLSARAWFFLIWFCRLWFVASAASQAISPRLDETFCFRPLQAAVQQSSRHPIFCTRTLVV